VRFEWDESKSEANRRKHGITFEEACAVFGDPLHLSLLDRRFGYYEERWVTLGQTDAGGLVVVAHLYFDDAAEEVIRIVSARRATMSERKEYESGFGGEDGFELKEEYDFSRGVRGRFYQPNKRTTTIRLDDDIVLYFKKKAGEQKVGYQTLVNAALREYVNRHTRE